jgi:hypothetical protein
MMCVQRVAELDTDVAHGCHHGDGDQAGEQSVLSEILAAVVAKNVRAALRNVAIHGRGEGRTRRISQ